MLRAVAVLALVVTATTSQPPAPAPAKAAQDNQSKADPKQNQPESKQQPASPTPARIDKGKAEMTLGNEKQPGKAEEDNSPEQGWPKITAILVAVFTGALAALAIVQAHAMRKQADYMRDALAATKDAAVAAKKSADTAERALNILERAEVVLSDVTITGQTADNWVPPGSTIKVVLTNTGRSRANDARCEIRLEIDASPTDDFIKAIGSGPFTIASGERHEIEFEPFIKVHAGATPPIEWPVMSIGSLFSVTCEITYTDVFGTPHVTNAFAKRSRADGEFRVTNFQAT